MSSPTGAAQAYPGQRLGLPEDGPGSVAGWGWRFLALLVDWIASRLVAAALVGGQVWSENGAEQLVVIAVFVIESALLTTLVGGSFGQLVVRVAVVRLDGGPVTLLRALARQLLVCLVVPPLVFNRDNRGLHDLAVGTITVRR